MTTPMMECGHAANATRAGDPVCAICFGITADAENIAAAPDLEGRTAVCSYAGHKPVPSSTSLAFFAHDPSKTFDLYYCGCWGWD